MVKLTEQDGKLLLHTNVFDLIRDFRSGMVNSDVLGCAFEPEQRFETPDGSTIAFDRNYHGNMRGVAPVPGPFASEARAEGGVGTDK